NLLEDGLATALLFALGAREPGVEAGGRDIEDLAHQRDGPARAVLVDEGEDHIASLAKNAVAFFKRSRSISRRRFSALSLWTSASRAGRLPLPGKASLSPWSSFSKACFQVRSRFSPMPRERAASATDIPFTVTNLTASTLNSRV